MTPKTSPSPDTRDRLVRTAAELLWERSFHAMGVDEICQRADARKGSFYHFFSSKTDLAIEAIANAWTDVRKGVFEPALATEGSGIERLRRVVEAVDQLQRGQYEARGVYLGCPFGGLGQEMAHQDVQLQAAVHVVFEGHIDCLEQALAQAVADGDIEPGDLRQRARALFALLEGALLVSKVANAPDAFGAVLKALPLIVARDPAPADTSPR